MTPTPSAAVAAPIPTAPVASAGMPAWFATLLRLAVPPALGYAQKLFEVVE